MSEPTSSLTFADLYTEVADYLGYARTSGSWTTAQTAEVKRFVNEGLSRFYMGLNPKNGTAYEWSFMSPRTSLVMFADVSGTCDGSPSHVAGTSTVTATASIFYASCVGHTLTIGSTDYTITGYTSGTVVSVSGDASGEDSDAALAITANGLYALPDDFAYLVSVPAYGPDEGAVYLQSCPSMDIERLRGGGGDTTGQPKLYAVIPRSTGTSGTRWWLQVWPIAEEDITLYYRYQVNVDEHSTDADYPLGGAMHAQTILEHCLAVAEERRFPGETAHQARADRLMAASISIDAKQKPRMVSGAFWRPTPFRVTHVGTVTYS